MPRAWPPPWGRPPLPSSDGAQMVLCRPIDEELSTTPFDRQSVDVCDARSNVTSEKPSPSHSCHTSCHTVDQPPRWRVNDTRIAREASANFRSLLLLVVFALETAITMSSQVKQTVCLPMVRSNQCILKSAAVQSHEASVLTVTIGKTAVRSKVRSRRLYACEHGPRKRIPLLGFRNKNISQVKPQS